MLSHKFGPGGVLVTFPRDAARPDPHAHWTRQRLALITFDGTSIRGSSVSRHFPDAIRLDTLQGRPRVPSFGTGLLLTVRLLEVAVCPVIFLTRFDRTLFRVAHVSRHFSDAI